MTTKQYCFVIDIEGKRLSPTNSNKGWYLIRKSKAKLVQTYPMVIQLLKVVEPKDIDSSTFICGIDTGSKHTGIAIVQECKNKTKVVLKGTIEHRNDVKKLIEIRKAYRKNRRSNKRYRPIRFNNRGLFKKRGWVAPSVKQKKDSILRVINYLKKYVNIKKFVIEEVAIDLRKLQDININSSQYQVSNRLDTNVRVATLMRDNFKCLECNKTNIKLEVHHITPRRLNGNNTLDNLITLCKHCHQKVQKNEEKFIENFYKKINGKNIRFDFFQHVMQGKSYFRNELNFLGQVALTVGSDTANKRTKWNIIKSHSNDAIVICNKKINLDQCNIVDWQIKPLRRQSKSKYTEICGLTHRDIVSYVTSKKEKIVGYITAVYADSKQINIQTKNKHWKRVNALKCSLVNRPNKIMWRYNS